MAEISGIECYLRGRHIAQCAVFDLSELTEEDSFCVAFSAGVKTKKVSNPDGSFTLKTDPCAIYRDGNGRIVVAVKS